MKKLFILAIVLLSASVSSFAQWNFDKGHSNLLFSVKHMSVTDFQGNFKSYTIDLTSAKEDLSDAKVTISIDAASVNTDIEARDKHIKSGDFFDVEKYANITFKSTSFKKVGDKKYKVKGDLTFHGVTKPIELDVTQNGTVTNPQNKKIITGFKVTGSFKRSDFGVGTSMPEFVVSDVVDLVANLEFNKDGK